MQQEALGPDADCSSGLGRRLTRVLERWPWLGGAMIAVLALTLNLAGNDRTGLWDRDEPRYAVAVRELRESGNWILPTYNGEPRYHKPILIYWLMGLSTSLAGDSPFGARLVSALAGTGTCLLVWRFGRRMLGERGGLLAALMLAVAPIMVAESKLATTDATLAFFLVACLLCVQRLSEGPSRWMAGAFWACLGLATLTKGPVGPALLLVSMALAWWWDWPVAEVWRRLRPRLGIAAFAILTLPWFVLAGLASRGDFFRFAVGDQLVHRVTTQMEEHGGFPGYYLTLSTLAMFPWSVLMPAALCAAWARRQTRPDLAFLLGWAVGPWILLEALPTRLLHYYLPAYPAWALLAAWFVEAVAEQESSLRRWPLGRLGLGLHGGIGILGVIVALGVSIAVPGPLRIPLAVLAIAIGLATLTGSLWLHRAQARQAALGLVGSWSMIMLLAGAWLIPAAEPYRMSRRVGDRLAALESSRGLEPVLIEYKEPGVVYSIGHPVPIVRDRGSLDALLEREGTLLTVLTPLDAQAFRENHPIVIDPIEDLEGFSLTKGRGDVLQIATVRRAGTSPRPVPSLAGAGPVEQALVK